MRYVMALMVLVVGACGGASATAPDATVPAGAIVFDGNSQTAPLHGHTPYPDFVMQELGDSLLTFANTAVPGQTTQDMIARGPSVVDPLHTTERVNVLVMWEGTNDLYFGATPAAAYQHLVEYATMRRAAGWKIVVLTLMPRTGVNTRTDFEAVRQQLNVMIRANWNTFADQIADVALDPRFGAAGAEENLTYFEDETHLTQYGISEMAKLAMPAVRRAIESETR